ncbi:uncharacterized protein YozE (UPF0346 family) [Methanolinea mesophila]|uniref:DUF4062 domain-containing protein n=1 Tax=Methanolinea mesophila TaxID=547055 RepID=UPI001AEB3B51|nr:DUF4062 domain-containing protein [Methanolinea mesophila]MBP1927822.1 uncharacterized protein YozE (UPF0346 family) [Methanolinea mesophila]
MVRPRVFVSSTYYDLKHIRENLKFFFEDMGFEPVLFERGDIPYSPRKPLDESCYQEIKNCHLLVLIIGGYYGNPSSYDQKTGTDEESEFYNSVTKKEFETAVEKGIPTFIFVDKAVYTEYKTYQKNIDREIEYAHVSHKNVFKLLDSILIHQQTMFLKTFENFDDISNYLREQLAGLFADYLTRIRTEKDFNDIQEQVKELKEITNSLRKYIESLMEEVKPPQYKEIIEKERRKEFIRTVQRFVKEPMIEYIIISLSPETSKSKIYRAMEESKSLENFLQNLGVDPDAISDFLAEHRKRALEDYKEIYEKYFISKPDEVRLE